MNVKVDRRHDRTAFEVDEVRRFLAAAHAGPERFGMTGQERALLYRLTVESGMRADELRTLRVSAFDLNACRVVVQAAYSKHREDDTLPPAAGDGGGPSSLLHKQSTDGQGVWRPIQAVD